MASRYLLHLVLLSLLPTPPRRLRLRLHFHGSHSGLTIKTLLLQSPSFTIFSPTDPVSVKNAQPPLSLLQFHLSPLPLSLRSLETLPISSTIPTLLPSHTLVLTSPPSDDYVFLNGVRIDGSPLFDEGSLIIFGIREFINPNFGVPRANPSCPIRQ